MELNINVEGETKKDIFSSIEEGRSLELLHLAADITGRFKLRGNPMMAAMIAVVIKNGGMDGITEDEKEPTYYLKKGNMYKEVAAICNSLEEVFLILPLITNEVENIRKSGPVDLLSILQMME